MLDWFLHPSHALLLRTRAGPPKRQTMQDCGRIAGIVDPVELYWRPVADTAAAAVAAQNQNTTAAARTSANPPTILHKGEKVLASRQLLPLCSVQRVVGI